ncbi:MAG TPA: aldolase [Aquifex aeolicus]|nr:aldolase [Aquifex aeolicus]
MDYIYKDFFLTAKMLAQEQLIYSYTGNLSRRWRNNLFITRTGANLRNLSKEDIIVLPFDKKSILETRASSELIVHKSILSSSGKKAVLHTHPIYTVKLSLNCDVITPKDSEGKAILGSVPVLKGEKPTASIELAEVLSEVLKEKKVAVIRGHGVFAVENSLFKAYEVVSILENSCKILWRCQNGEKS